MSKLQQIEASVLELSAQEQKALSEWLENLLEDRLTLREDFRAEIEQGIQEIQEGRGRTRQP
jgi:non-ribosomal peptide synthetase component F